VRTGSADLPLHGGHVPRWLADRMTSLGRVLTEAVVLTYGPNEMLRRLSHPFWFQSLGCVMGMDWHSSGITTSVLGALKRGLAPIQDELGLYVCGGRGNHSRRTPQELTAVGERTGADAASLVRASRMVAKVDGACVQDGFELYLHGFFVTRDGTWTVVQQGMNGDRKIARRYHWLSDGLRSFVSAPHAAIEGEPVGEIVNLTDARAEAARTAHVALVKEGPDRLVAELARIEARPPGPAGLHAAAAMQGTLPFPEAPHLRLPTRHHLTGRDVVLRRVHAALAAAHERGPVDFTDLLAVPGLGARTLFSLSLLAEVLHGAPSRFTDPARFSLAHGGKDGHPFPVPLRVYDETIRVMKQAVSAARLGETDRLCALRRLDDETRRIDRASKRLVGPALDELLHHERTRSHAYGGRSVMGHAQPPEHELPAQPRSEAPPGRRVTG
jgi:uncharacterized protein